MAYTAEISRSNPTCFLFLVDQSGSMAQPFGNESGRTKAQGVADAINRLLQTLVHRCSKGDYILDRYYIGAIGYGDEIGLGFRGDLAGGVLRTVSEIGNFPLRIEDRTKKVEDGAGGLVVERIRFPMWFEPIAQGKTPMYRAFEVGHEVISEFVREHPGCFPPICINISDGMATDADPEPMAESIKSVASRDGNVLLFNIHISASGETPILFPTTDNGLRDEYARRLFRMSSPLPPAMLMQAQMLEASVGEDARGFGFNADLTSVIMFLDIGTRVDSSFR